MKSYNSHTHDSRLTQSQFAIWNLCIQICVVCWHFVSLVFTKMAKIKTTLWSFINDCVSKLVSFGVFGTVKIIFYTRRGGMIDLETQQREERTVRGERSGDPSIFSLFVFLRFHHASSPIATMASSSEREMDVENARRGVWLVKVPKYLSTEWEKVPAMTEIGRLKIGK